MNREHYSVNKHPNHRTMKKIILSTAFFIALFQNSYGQQSQLTTPIGEQFGKISKLDTRWQRGGIFEGKHPEDEILEKRTGYTKKFNKRNGTVDIIFGGPFHYKDSQGAWQDIDLALKQSNDTHFPFFNEDNKFISRFGNTHNDGVKIEFQKQHFSFGQNISLNAGTWTPSSNVATDISTKENSIIYKNVYNDVDVEYEISSDAIFHRMKFRSANIFSGVSLQNNLQVEEKMTLPLNAVLVDSLGLVNSNRFVKGAVYVTVNTDTVFTIIPSRIWDSSFKGDPFNPFQEKEINSDGFKLIETKIVWLSSKEIKLTAQISLSWLLSTDRVFPIVFDPTISIGGTGAFIDYLGFSFRYPWRTNYWQQVSQSLYWQSEIATAGDITAIAYKQAVNEGMANSNARIQMQTTSSSTFAWPTSFITSGWTTCYNNQTLNYSSGSGTSTSSPAPVWRTINLTTPFYYNNSQNLIIETKFQNVAWTGGGGWYHYSRSGSVILTHGSCDCNSSYPTPLNNAINYSYLAPVIQLTITPTPTTSITVTTPNGGENWIAGSSYYINWTSSNVSGGVDILYSTNAGSTWTTIVTNASNTGSNYWTAPSSINSSSSRVRVRSNSNVAIYDDSNSNFTIAPLVLTPIVTITTPNGGESWTAGNSNNINWNSANVSGGVDILYSTNAGSSWTSIVTNTTNSGSYSWSIPPSINSTQCRVRMRSNLNTSVYDDSNSNFTIATSASTISITASVIPPWQRENDVYQGSVIVSTANPSNGSWHLQIKVYNSSTGSLIATINYPSITTATQNFFSTDPQLKANSIEGRHMKYYAVLDANAPQAGTTDIIESKWVNKNVIYYNASGQLLKIPLKYVSGTTSISYSFARVSGKSSAVDNIVDGSGTISGSNNQYIMLSNSNSNLQNVNPGVFRYTITYNSVGIQEQSRIDLIKIGNIGNLGSKSVVVLVGGSVNIEAAIKKLPSQYNSKSLDTWSIAKDFVNNGKNTWYIATSNLNPLQKNAYNLGIALEKIKELSETSTPEISVLAHSKGGLEMRIMMDKKGVSNVGSDNFTISPDYWFDNPSIDGKLKAVIFLGTPHNDGVEVRFNTGFTENTIAPASYLSSQINNSQIINYFLSGTSVPSGIRFGNVSAYRNCNLSDGAVSPGSSGFPVLLGISPNEVKKFFVKDIGPPELNQNTQIAIGVICNVVCNSAALLSTFIPQPVACYEACELAPHIIDIYREIWWQLKFHHLYLTSSYFLNNDNNSCLIDGLQGTPTFNKILSVINNTAGVSCSSPYTQSCRSLFWQLISSVLPNAQISKLKVDGSFVKITKSDENGIFELLFDETLSLEDTIKIEAPGIETMLIPLNSEILSNKKIMTPMMKSGIPTNKIQ